MRRTLPLPSAGNAAIAFAVLVVAAALPAHAQTSSPDRQTVRAGLTTARPDAATGSWLQTDFADPANPGGKPYALDKLVIESGIRLDGAAVPRCEATDAELMARGAAACPADAQVQAGRMVMDTGSPLLVPRLLRFKTVTFNAPSGLVSLGEAENFLFRGVVRSRVRGRVVTVDYANAPGWGGPDGQSAMQTMFTSGPALRRGGRAFMRTPRTCPRSRRWTTRYTFVYYDGVRQRETARTPCRR